MTTLSSQMEQEIRTNQLLTDEDKNQAIDDLRKGAGMPQVMDGFPSEGSLNVGEYRVLYHRATGMEVEVVLSMYSQMLEWTHGSNHALAGQPVYSIHPIPGKAPKRGTIKCLLHPDHPRFADLQEWGMPVCYVDSLPNPAELGRHMAMYHKTAWEDIKEFFPELARLKPVSREEEKAEPAPTAEEETETVAATKTKG